MALKGEAMDGQNFCGERLEERHLFQESEAAYAKAQIHHISKTIKKGAYWGTVRNKTRDLV